MAHYREFQLVFRHLHAVKVLLYAESVGVVTSGHVTKMTVKLLDLPLPKTPCYMQTERVYFESLLGILRSFIPHNFTRHSFRSFLTFHWETTFNFMFTSELLRFQKQLGPIFVRIVSHVIKFLHTVS